MKSNSFLLTSRFWGCVCLLFGNAIGAAMLVMPITMGLSGFFPSVIRCVITMVMSLFAAFVLVDESASIKEEFFDSPKILEKLFPGSWQILSSLLLFLFFTALLSAYVVGGAKVICDLLDIDGGSAWISLIFGLVMAFIVSCRLTWVEVCNTPFTILIFLSFFYLLACCFPNADYTRLFYSDNLYAFYTMPIIVAAMGFHNVIPCMYLALDRDTRQLRTSIVIALSLVVFLLIVWGFATISAIPISEEPTKGAVLFTSDKILPSACRSFLATQYCNSPVTLPLGNIVHFPGVLLTGICFSLLALITSYFGVGLSIKGTVRDILLHGIKYDNRALCLLLAFGPSILIAIFCPGSFISVMSNVVGPLYVLIFITLPCILAIRNHAYPVWKRILGIVFLIISCLTILLNFCSNFGLLKIQSEAEKEYRETYIETKS